MPAQQRAGRHDLDRELRHNSEQQRERGEPGPKGQTRNEVGADLAGEDLASLMGGDFAQIGIFLKQARFRSSAG
jgi:hypothetical protein